MLLATRRHVRDDVPQRPRDRRLALTRRVVVRMRIVGDECHVLVDTGAEQLQREVDSLAGQRAQLLDAPSVGRVPCYIRHDAIRDTHAHDPAFFPRPIPLAYSIKRPASAEGRRDGATRPLTLSLTR